MAPMLIRILPYGEGSDIYDGENWIDLYEACGFPIATHLLSNSPMEFISGIQATRIINGELKLNFTSAEQNKSEDYDKLLSDIINKENEADFYRFLLFNINVDDEDPGKKQRVMKMAKRIYQEIINSDGYK